MDDLDTYNIVEMSKNSSGRPRKEIDLIELEKVAELSPTQEELASFFDVSLSTIKRRLNEDKYKEAYDRGYYNSNLSLRRKIHQKAMDGNTSMLIFLAKTRLGMNERLQQNAEIKEPPKLVVVCEGPVPEYKIIDDE